MWRTRARPVLKICMKMLTWVIAKPSACSIKSWHDFRRAFHWKRKALLAGCRKTRLFSAPCYRNWTQGTGLTGTGLTDWLCGSLAVFVQLYLLYQLGKMVVTYSFHLYSSSSLNFILCLIPFKVDELNKLSGSQCMGLHSSAGRVLQHERRGHGFQSHWSPAEKLFSLPTSQFLKLRFNCDGHISISAGQNATKNKRSAIKNHISPQLYW